MNSNFIFHYEHKYKKIAGTLIYFQNVLNEKLYL